MKYAYPILALVITGLIVYLSSIPDLAIVRAGSKADQILSNLAHIPAYGILTFMWLKSFNGSLRHRSRAVFNGLILIGLLLFSITDEIHQSFVPGRTASALDVGLDLLGIFLGLAIWRASESFHEKPQLQ